MLSVSSVAKVLVAANGCSTAFVVNLCLHHEETKNTKKKARKRRVSTSPAGIVRCRGASSLRSRTGMRRSRKVPWGYHGTVAPSARTLVPRDRAARPIDLIRHQRHATHNSSSFKLHYSKFSIHHSTPSAVPSRAWRLGRGGRDPGGGCSSSESAWTPSLWCCGPGGR